MTDGNQTSPTGIARFRSLAASLAQFCSAELQFTGPLAVLVDEAQAARLLIEFDEIETSAHVVFPFMPIPQDANLAAALVARLLGMSAVTAALGGASFGSDIERGQYCLVLSLELGMEQAEFVKAVHQLVMMGKRVCAAVEDLLAAEHAMRPGHVDRA
ncbi:MAG: hypothetical protein V4787_07000 [Pseudomonadota bacterium]